MTRPEPFSYVMTKSGDIRISRGGRVVTVVRGKSAAQLIARLDIGKEVDQQILARVTGNYRRGNERSIT